MAIFSSFKRSALELKSVKCLAVTALLIALACVLKSLTIMPMPTMKISFAFIAVASIGMLYGPSVAGLACIATDIIGYLVSNQANAFSPLFTLVEVTGGIIYGIFLYNFNPVNLDFRSSKDFFKGIKSNLVPVFRVIMAKFTINLVCNVIMNTTFMVVMNYITPELFWVKIGERIVKNAIMLPIEVVILMLALFPIKVAYRTVFKTQRKSV